MALNLDELDLVDDKQEKFVLSQEANDDFNKALRNSINQTEQIKSAYDLARETYEKEQINPMAAFIESYKPVRNEEKEARLKKAAAVNSIGQALTNVIDAIYGKKGAYIPIRNNNTTTGILNTLAQEEGKYEQDLDKYNNLKLSQMIQDINLGKKQEQSDKEWERKNQFEEKQFQNKDALLEKQIKGRENIEGIKGTNQEKVATIRSNASIKAARIRETKSKEGDNFYVIEGVDPETREIKEVNMPKSVYRGTLVEVLKRTGDKDGLLAKYDSGDSDFNTKQKIENAVLQNWDKYFEMNENGKWIAKDTMAPKKEDWDEIAPKTTPKKSKSKEDDPLGLF